MMGCLEPFIPDNTEFIHLLSSDPYIFMSAFDTASETDCRTVRPHRATALQIYSRIYSDQFSRSTYTNAWLSRGTWVSRESNWSLQGKTTHVQIRSWHRVDSSIQISDTANNGIRWVSVEGFWHTGLPLGPSSPGGPRAPAGPAAPGGPDSPFSPVSPRGPWRETSQLLSRWHQTCHNTGDITLGSEHSQLWQQIRHYSFFWLC